MRGSPAPCDAGSRADWPSRTTTSRSSDHRLVPAVWLDARRRAPTNPIRHLRSRFDSTTTLGDRENRTEPRTKPRRRRSLQTYG